MPAAPGSNAPSSPPARRVGAPDGPASGSTGMARPVGCRVSGEVSHPGEASRVRHDDPERVSVGLDASCCVQRVTGLDERQVLGGLAGERDSARSRCRRPGGNRRGTSSSTSPPTRTIWPTWSASASRSTSGTPDEPASVDPLLPELDDPLAAPSPLPPGQPRRSRRRRARVELRTSADPTLPDTAGERSRSRSPGDPRRRSLPRSGLPRSVDDDRIAADGQLGSPAIAELVDSPTTPEDHDESPFARRGRGGVQ